MVDFIDDHRGVYGVEPICERLPIAPSTYHAHKARQRDPQRRSDREKADVARRGHVRRVWQASGGRYGARKVWRQLDREGVVIARDTVRRLMRQMGLVGVRRDRAWVATTQADASVSRPADLVDRDFTVAAPNQLWVSDLSYVATWRGFVYVAFVIDAFSRMIVGWRATTHLRTDLALDALEQALYDRGRDGVDGLVHHSDRGVQYLSIRYTDRLAEAGIEPSVGSVGDPYDNSLAESIIGLYKTEVIRHQGPWRNLDQVEFATLEWVHWFNTTRLLGPLGHLPPIEYEANHYADTTPATEAGLNPAGLR